MDVVLNDRLCALLFKYVKRKQVVAVSNSAVGEQFCKKLALHAEQHNLQLSFIPTSFSMGKLLHSLHAAIASLNDKEIDLAFDFVDSVDEGFHFIKLHSTSLVRDKMIAVSAAELIVVAREESYGRLSNVIPMEVVDFGVTKTLAQLENLGYPSLRVKENRPFKTETGNVLVDVVVDRVHALEDIETEAKDIPGVIETGLFLDYADRIVLQGERNLEVKSRLQHERLQ